MVDNYRQIYEEHFNIIIPIGFDIHHLNLNHEDNEIENLLMLPLHIHSRLHKCIGYASSIIFDATIKSVNESGHQANDFNYERASQFISMYREVCRWKDYKEFLLGNLPNIHKIII